MKNSGENIIVSHNCQSSSCNRWTVTGKVSDVIRANGSSKPDLHFDYDAMGQRIAKKVTNKNTTDGTDKFVTTYYVRNPQGKVLAVYEKKEDAAGAGQFQLKERHLYGMNRLGMVSQNVTLAQFDNSNVTNGTDPTTPQAGDTHYELTNHLGNVMAVISDKASTTSEPTVVSLSDYYPFGMTEPGRSYTRPGDDYRFGYTGHEKENDLAEGVYTTEYRLLDTRLGRWMSVDKLAGDYAWMSPYNYCEGNPVLMVDPDGRSGVAENGGGPCKKAPKGEPEEIKRKENGFGFPRETKRGKGKAEQNHVSYTTIYIIEEIIEKDYNLWIYSVAVSGYDNYFGDDFNNVVDEFHQQSDLHFLPPDNVRKAYSNKKYFHLTIKYGWGLTEDDVEQNIKPIVVNFFRRFNSVAELDFSYEQIKEPTPAEIEEGTPTAGNWSVSVMLDVENTKAGLSKDITKKRIKKVQVLNQKNNNSSDKDR